MKTITYNQIKEETKNTNYLLDFLNNYYFYKLDGFDRGTKNITKEELEKLLNQDEIVDNISEFADSQVDVYNGALLEWLNKDNNFLLYDEAIDNFWDAGSLINNIRQAQFFDIEQELNEELREFIDEFELEEVDF